MESNSLKFQIHLFQVSLRCVCLTSKEWKIRYQHCISSHVVCSCFNWRGLQGLSVLEGIPDLKGLWWVTLNIYGMSLSDNPKLHKRTYFALICKTELNVLLTQGLFYHTIQQWCDHIHKNSNCCIYTLNMPVGIRLSLNRKYIFRKYTFSNCI